MAEFVEKYIFHQFLGEENQECVQGDGSSGRAAPPAPFLQAHCSGGIGESMTRGKFGEHGWEECFGSSPDQVREGGTAVFRRQNVSRDVDIFRIADSCPGPRHVPPEIMNPISLSSEQEMELIGMSWLLFPAGRRFLFFLHFPESCSDPCGFLPDEPVRLFLRNEAGKDDFDPRTGQNADCHSGCPVGTANSIREAFRI